MDDLHVHWYPGHMAKARRQLRQLLPQVDAVLEVADARIPVSSRHPDLPRLLGTKPRVLLLAREDLADPRANRGWLRWLRAQGEAVVAANLRRGGWPERVRSLLRAAAGNPRGPVRAAVVGIPNVGKSTAINALARRRGTRTGAVPGVTRGQHWIAGPGPMEWLDTPGILWPRLEDPAVRFGLAATGAVPDRLLDPEAVALALIRFLQDRYPEALSARYGRPEQAGPEEGGPFLPEREWLEHVGRVRGVLAAGGRVDGPRAAALILGDFREGRLGRITLEMPPWEGAPGDG